MQGCRHNATTSICKVTGKRHRIADPNDAGTLHLGVEREFTVESLNDVAKHAGVNLQRVGVDGRHVTTPAQRVQPDDRTADMQTRTGPLAFSQSIDAGDDDVRTKASDIASESSNRAVGGDKKREYVEAIQAIPRFELRRVVPAACLTSASASGLFHV